ncbi:MAG: pilus assembly protein [Sphingobium sp.]|uniref:TadE/TadG family type IV pilus assembly protein n=1 Tax=Sphingobium sp. TaxID=1912891 RepID=UPI0029A2CE0E|nr:TadE/TadG family type IV pilus assembly protein [Sphingobium sp.]MDX3909994.1 pilus assembly protein [Sphingobium sp.]
MNPFVIKRIAQSRDGVTIVEFAVVAAPLIFLVLGSLDLAYQSYATAVVQGTTNAAARKATLEGASASTIETYVRSQLNSIASGTNLQISSANFLTYNKIGKPEKLTTDVDGNGVYDKSGPDCFIDDNRNGLYDSASQGAAGIGTAEDVVRYKITATYNRLSPLPQLMGMGNSVTISRETFMRNEPYAGVVDPPVECGK